MSSRILRCGVVGLIERPLYVAKVSLVEGSGGYQCGIPNRWSTGLQFSPKVLASNLNMTTASAPIAMASNLLATASTI